MSFATQYTFGGPPPVQYAADLALIKSTPGLVLDGTEVNGVYSETREVSGQVWTVTNAAWNGSGWMVVNPVAPAAAMSFSGGVLNLYTAPGNSTPGFSWILVWSSSLSTAGPYFFIGAYGGPTDNVTDAFPAWNRAYTAAKENDGGTILLGPNNYNMSSMPNLNADNVNMLGMGEGTTTITPTYSFSSTNPGILMLGPQGGSRDVSGFTLVGPGGSAAGTLPGATTVKSPNLGTGWGLISFGGRGDLISYINCQGVYHGIFLVCASDQRVENCDVGNGGPGGSTQYGIAMQGPSGTAGTGSFTLSGSVTSGTTTFSIVLDDGQGNVLTIGPYTATAADQSGGINHFAQSVAAFITNSAACQGPLGNWNTFSAGGAVVSFSIDVSDALTTPTYTPSSSGGVSVTPSSLTQVSGGAGQGNPRSIVLSVSNCSVVGNPTTEGIHVDGGTGSISVTDFGSRGNQYGIRFVNANSGNANDAKLATVQNVSGDHNRISTVSLENGHSVHMINVNAIAGYGGGPPVVNWDINIGPNAGGDWSITSPRLSSSAGGGIGVAAGGGTITDPRIFQVGSSYLSGIGFYGTAAIIGLTIKGGKIGAEDLSTGGGGSNSYAIDLAGPGAPNAFAGTLQSVTIQNVDVTGSAGAINRGSTVSNSIAAFGLNTYITIDNNPGDYPLLDVSQPPATIVSNVATVINPFVSQRYVTMIPDGSHAITQVQLKTSDGNVTFTPTLGNGIGFPVSIGATQSLAVTLSAGGSLSWFWS